MKYPLTLAVVALASTASAFPLLPASFPITTSPENHRPCHGHNAHRQGGVVAWIIGQSGLISSYPGKSRSYAHSEVLAAVHTDDKSDEADLLSQVAQPAVEDDTRVYPPVSPPHFEIIFTLDDASDEAQSQEVDLDEWRSLESRPYYSKHRHHLEADGHGEHHRHSQHGHSHHGQHSHKSLSHRIGHALSRFSTTEILVFTFILGAGLGSIFHLFFMMILISYRFAIGDKRTRAERRADRKARREGREGQIKLGEKDLPPIYERDEVSLSVEAVADTKA